MPTLVSPGVSVTIIDESFYIPASASTVPLIFLATRADKTKADGVTPAPGALESGVVRTITSLNQAVDTWGVPYFREDVDGKPLHGDARNEYGLLALNQALTVISRAYVIRADVDLADDEQTVYTALTPVYAGTGTGTLGSIVPVQATAQEELWTLTAISATEFTVEGFLSGAYANATVGTPYTNARVGFTITAGGVPFVAGDVFTFEVNMIEDPAFPAGQFLGSTDAERRATIVEALAAQINGNEDIRSDLYEYNLILCPGYHEVAADMIALNVAINEEALVISDTPFDKTPEDTAVWSLTVDRQTNTNIAYYYPHQLCRNLDGATVFGSASGVALKTIGYSDNVAEVWFPAAGPRRGVVTGVLDVGYVSGTLGTATTFVSTPLNQGQRDVLYENQKNINPISYLIGRGIIVMGQKTSAPLASARDRINVERMLLKVKRDIRKASFAYLYELNDRVTRESIKQMIDDYLNDIMQRRGLYDYVVVCDESNNTPARVDRNELWVDIALKPAKAVEFIYIPMRVVNTGADI